jgi:hypothetical protein
MNDQHVFPLRICLAGILALCCLSGAGCRHNTPAAPIAPAAQPTSPPKSDEWQTFTCPEGGFSVRMPGIPVRREIPVNGHKYTSPVDDAQRTYFVVYVDLHMTPTDKEEIKAIFDQVANAELKVQRVQEHQEKEITLDGYPGREITYEAPVVRPTGIAVATLRMFLVKTKLYEVATLTHKERLKDAHNEDFFHSFTLLKPGAHPPAMTLPPIQPKNLVEAIKFNDQSAALAFLDSGADPNSTDTSNTALQRPPTALLLAVCNDEETDTVTRALLKRGAEVNVTDDYGTSPLSLAAACNYIAKVKALLEYGAPVNTQNDYGMTALMQAARLGRTEIVKTLLDHAADVSLQDTEGHTARMWAESRHHEEIVRLLQKAEKSMKH